MGANVGWERKRMSKIPTEKVGMSIPRTGEGSPRVAADVSRQDKGIARSSKGWNVSCNSRHVCREHEESSLERRLGVRRRTVYVPSYGLSLGDSFVGFNNSNNMESS